MIRRVVSKPLNPNAILHKGNGQSKSTYKKRLNKTEGTAMRPMKILNRLRYLLWSAEIMYQGLPVPLTFLLVEPS